MIAFITQDYSLLVIQSVRNIFATRRYFADLIEQMDDSERRAYLAESLFLNTVKYENDKLEAYMKKLAKK